MINYLGNEKLYATINENEKFIEILLNNFTIATFFYDNYEIKKDIFHTTKYVLCCFSGNHYMEFNINDYQII